MAIGPTKEFSPQAAQLAYGSISGTNAATANTLLTLSRYARLLIIKNDTDVTMGVTYNASTIWYLTAGASLVIDGAISGLSFNGGRVIGVHRDGSAPNSGRVQVVAS